MRLNCKPVKNSQKQIGILTKSISLLRNTKYLLEKIPHKFTFFIFNYHVMMSRSVIENDSTIGATFWALRDILSRTS